MKSREELIALLALAAPGKDATNMDDAQIIDEIIAAFQAQFPDEYSELVSLIPTAGEEQTTAILDLAADKFQSGETGDIDTSATGDSNGDPEVKTDKGSKHKSKSNSKVIDSTKALAASFQNRLPSDVSDTLMNTLKSKMGTLAENGKKYQVTALLIDTPIREKLKGATFTCTNEDAASEFQKKYPRESVLQDEENLANYDEILRRLTAKEAFEVNVPKATSQKVIGVEITSTDKSKKVETIPMAELAFYLLSNFGGTLANGPMQVGVQQVKSVYKDDVEDKTKRVPVIKFAGKPEAMNDVDGKPSNKVKATAEPLSESAAMQSFGRKDKEYAVRSALSFKYIKTDAEGVKTERTAYVRGKITGPFYTRMEAYKKAGFPEVNVGKFLKAITEDDFEAVAQVIMSYAGINDKSAAQIANSLNLPSILDALNAGDKEAAPVND